MQSIQMLNCNLEEVSEKVAEKLMPHLEKLVKDLISQQHSGKEFLSRKETAEFFGISLVGLHEWMKRGIVTPLKCANKTYFERAKLVQMLLDSNKK